MFWIGGRVWEVITYERWSHMEVRLYWFSCRAEVEVVVSTRLLKITWGINRQAHSFMKIT